LKPVETYCKIFDPALPWHHLLVSQQDLFKTLSLFIFAEAANSFAVKHTFTRQLMQCSGTLQFDVGTFAQQADCRNAFFRRQRACTAIFITCLGLQLPTHDR